MIGDERLRKPREAAEHARLLDAKRGGCPSENVPKVLFGRQDFLGAPVNVSLPDGRSMVWPVVFTQFSGYFSVT